MILNLQNKRLIITKISEINRHAQSAVIANYNNVTVNQMTELRRSCRTSGVYMHVVRNTILYRILENTTFSCLQDELTGPTLIAYSMDHPGSAARLLQEFAKIHTKFKIKAAAFKGELIPASQIDRLASIPTFEEAIKRLIVIMKEISTGKLIRILVSINNIKKLY